MRMSSMGVSVTVEVTIKVKLHKICAIEINYMSSITHQFPLTSRYIKKKKRILAISILFFEDGYLKMIKRIPKTLLHCNFLCSTR